MHSLPNLTYSFIHSLFIQSIHFSLILPFYSSTYSNVFIHSFDISLPHLFSLIKSLTITTLLIHLHLTYPCFYLLTYLVAHSLIFTHIFICLHLFSLTDYPLTSSLTHSLINLLSHSLINSFAHSLILNSLTRCFPYPLIHSLIHSSLFSHLFINDHFEICVSVIWCKYAYRKKRAYSVGEISIERMNVVFSKHISKEDIHMKF